MPRHDGTGPQGLGPRTGRGVGNCKPNPESDATKPIDAAPQGLGLGNRPRRNLGRGLGKGPNRNQGQ